MFKRIIKNPVFTIFLLFSLLLLPALACGSTDTPTKVGEVEQETGEADATEVVVDEVSEADRVSPTELPAEPTATAEPEPTKAQVQTNFAVGDIIDFGDLVMIVLGWSSPPGDDFTQPEDGNKFVAVDLVFVNTGSSPDSVSSMLQMQLKDSTNQVYNIDFEASMAVDASSPEGEISPGERIRGSVGFQTPSDVTGLQFVFDATFLGGDRVFVELGDEPMFVEAPETIEGETELTTFEVGDEIEIGDLGLVIHEVTFPIGDEFNRPNEGQKFVSIDLSVTNNSATSQSISSMLQMQMKDKTGQIYGFDLMASVAAGTSPDGELAPGETLRGQVGFQIPIDAEGLLFVFDADFLGGGKVFINIPNA